MYRRVDSRGTALRRRFSSLRPLVTLVYIMPPDPLSVLYEDNHLLVINKRAGVVTQGAQHDQVGLIELAKDYLKRKYNKPGNVYLGVVSRLDALVSGAVVLARTSKAAARLTEQFRSRTVNKIYWALVEGSAPEAGACVDWLLHDESQQRVIVARAQHGGAQEARLSYRRLFASRTLSLLEVTLETGRKHQIRVQLAERSLPILGDRKYGSRTTFSDGIALHAREISFEHPTRDEVIRLLAPPPQAWKTYLPRELHDPLDQRPEEYQGTRETP